MAERSPDPGAGDEGLSRLVAEALRLLDVRSLALCLHDASFPGDPGDDLGRGAPASDAGLGFAAFVRRLGFDVLQLGPQGRTPADDPSPYRGSIFVRNPLSIALAPLTADGEWGRLLAPEALQAAVARRPAGALARATHDFAQREHGLLLEAASRALQAPAPPDLPRAAREAREGQRAAWRRFEKENEAWLSRYALFEALRRETGHTDWRAFSGPDGAGLDARLFAPGTGEAAACRTRRESLRARHEAAVADFHFGQFVAHAQHRRLREAARSLGLRLHADLQVGWAPEDEWAHRDCLLDGYRMGAPPSRTNPEGQPWGYAVLDPDAYDAAPGGAAGAAPGPVRRVLRLRLDRIFADYDGVRVDHPHGLVCPWVYDARDPDPSVAVRLGARLFESPDLPDHPALARFAIAQAGDLHSAPRPDRWADDWVVSLREGQVSRYARLFDDLVEAARQHGRGPEDVACEVLSTLPFPLRRVLERHGLGRFRVTQKASLTDPHDGYRSENARPEDWIMAGNHDTPPIWQVARTWGERGEIPARAAALAQRLAPDPGGAAPLAARLEADPGLLVHAVFADLLASPARNVLVFFTDLLGLEESYNRPGTRLAENWSLRVPPDYAALHAVRCERLRALDLPFALALALRSGSASRARRQLADALAARSRYRG